MKLFLYDTKHQQVNGSTDLGNLTDSEVALVNKVIAFLYDQLILDGRYRSITLAEDIDVIYDEQEPLLVIRDAH